ncbi:serine/threonine protein phosphatase [Oceanicoccus sp. KOV_DT_Chl]|uniref:serine/threonine protein phosphatase n=1 Tax=Oceanicoccus sp. KOV_DT_Chl TaxID=1904639 RepID=UPI000C7D1D2D|nr:serine/threonine protein phosphatase [Oceanicoccus sp. KOV_DT_Chl]
MRFICFAFFATLLAACSTVTPPLDKPFTVAVLPDTQNALDYRHQKAAGFALDSSELLIQQMQFIVANSQANGGDIAFVAAVGDVWQHQTKRMDEQHKARGFQTIENPFFALELEITDKTFTVEIPKAIEAYSLLDQANIPFGVAPGNHDYDAMWSDSSFPLAPIKNIRELTITPEDLGMLHIGGLDNFRSAFSSDSPFFMDKPWYISSFNGGANSAQLFNGGGYRFLHIAVEMQPADDVIEWATKVITENPGLPTIISTHDYLNVDGERLANPIVDLNRIDPDFHNSAEEMWQKFISRHDQIFLVLCGHQHGQSMRVDNNVNGYKVYQVLADYQDRGQAGIDHGQPLDPHRRIPVGTGDGWLRLMTFDVAAKNPTITVKTYSSYYQAYSSEIKTYAQWYKNHEQPEMTDKAFYAADDFIIELDDFKQRFRQSQKTYRQ